MRSEDAVPPYIPDLIEARGSKHRTQGLLVVIRKTIAGKTGYMFLESTRITIDHTGCRSWNACVARAVRKRKRKAARIIENRTNLPATDDLVHNSVRMGEQQLVATEWQLSQTVNDDLLLTDVSVPALRRPWIPCVKGVLPGGTPLPGIVRIH